MHFKLKFLAKLHYSISESQDPREIIQKCWFAARNISKYFCCWTVVQLIIW